MSQSNKRRADFRDDSSSSSSSSSKNNRNGIKHAKMEEEEEELDIAGALRHQPAPFQLTKSAGGTTGQGPRKPLQDDSDEEPCVDDGESDNEVEEEAKNMKEGGKQRRDKEKAFTDQLRKQGINLSEDGNDVDDVKGVRKEVRDLFENDEKDGDDVEKFEMEGFWNREGRYIDEDESNKVRDEWLDSVDAGNQVYNPSKTEKYSKPNFSESGLEDVKSQQLQKQFRLRQQIAGILLPEESVVKALKRLGNKGQGRKAGAQTTQRTRKYGKKKDDGSSMACESTGVPSKEEEEKQKANEAAFNQLSDCADELLGYGVYGIYQETKEQCIEKIKKCAQDIQKHTQLERQNAASSSSNASSGNNNNNSSSSSSSSGNTDNMWEYKWKRDSEEVFGPFTGAQMTNWREKGYFDNAFVRRVGKYQSEWMQSSRSTRFDM